MTFKNTGNNILGKNWGLLEKVKKFSIVENLSKMPTLKILTNEEHSICHNKITNFDIDVFGRVQ